MPPIPVYIAVISGVGLTIATLLLLHLTYTSIGDDRHRPEAAPAPDLVESENREDPATASGA